MMKEITTAKFKRNPDITQKLLSTNDEYLVEGNNWRARIWGQVDGQGQNLLGQILMETREFLKEKVKDNVNDEIER